MELLAVDGPTEAIRYKPADFAGERVSFEGGFREEQLTIEGHFESTAIAWQQERTRDPRRPAVEELSHQTGGSICVVSDDAEFDLELVRSIGRVDVHAHTLRLDGRARMDPALSLRRRWLAGLAEPPTGSGDVLAIAPIVSRRGPAAGIEKPPDEQCCRQAQHDLTGKRPPEKLLNANEAIAHRSHADIEEARGRPKVLAGSQVHLDCSEEFSAVARRVEDRADLAVDRCSKKPLVS